MKEVADDDRINLIADVINCAKAKAIKRILRRLEALSPNDVQFLERLLTRGLGR